ncbi:MAG: cytochrome b [Methylotenera sp.]|nr:cytochrome b [Methylotenera sp.]MDO9232362.1 cytochrome b [Methylotenera sp.]MDO9389029.1 cytochrome b [Methylotenera sp.]MDP1597222.1 cytochrome b [Methylotenera sp.]MDP1755017.1 cytochrome b [Methylotenera sp.]
MSWKNTSKRYGTLSIGLHWLMLLLFIAVYACIELRELYPKGSDPREALKTWHFMLGLSIWVLVALRIYARLSSPIPSITPEPVRWQMLSAKLAHLALYGLMIIMPLLGWLLLSASGKPIPFFGLELPALVAKNKELAGLVKEVHQTMGVVGYYLIGLHATAALFHHYYIKDDTLIRILPDRK